MVLREGAQSISTSRPTRGATLLATLVVALALYAGIGHGFHSGTMEGNAMHGVFVCLAVGVLAAPALVPPRRALTRPVVSLIVAAPTRQFTAPAPLARERASAWLQRFLN